MPELQLGQMLGPYRLESVLGEGAIGVVFRAEGPDGRDVAVKVLKRDLSQDEAYTRRFRREARVAQEVRHGHLVPILEAGHANGYHYLVVSYAGGGSLADRLAAHGRLPVEDCVQVGAEIGAGLHALHAAGIVHRDVKPSNIMFDESGRAALTDFGLAKGRAYTVLTKPGEVMGTLDYIAPELISGEGAGPSGDIYALACVVYECLTGAAPFAHRRLFEVAVAHLEDEPRDPCDGREELPAGLGRVVLGALAKKPEHRPRTGTAFAHLLRAAASGR